MLNVYTAFHSNLLYQWLKTYLLYRHSVKGEWQKNTSVWKSPSIALRKYSWSTVNIILEIQIWNPKVRSMWWNIKPDTLMDGWYPVLWQFSVCGSCWTPQWRWSAAEPVVASDRSRPSACCHHNKQHYLDFSGCCHVWYFLHWCYSHKNHSAAQISNQHSPSSSW